MWCNDAAGTYERDGFIASAGPVLDPDVLDDLRARLDALHVQGASLPRRRAGDLGPVHRHTGTFEISEVTQVRELDFRLRTHPAVTVLSDLAAELLGAPVWCAYDHSIYKPAHCPHEIAWHQDAAFARRPVEVPSAHLWLALDDVDERNGGLRYWPGSHRLGPVAHAKAHPGGRGHQLRASVEPHSAVAVALPAGGVVAHHPLTFHGSSRSTSEAARRSWTLQMRTGHPPTWLERTAVHAWRRFRA